MQTRQLGKNGQHLTILGFGSWALGGSWQWGWGKADDKESVEAIQTALESGVNWIDTAAVYGFGHSEKIVAESVKGFREKIFIATKCGLVNDGKNNAVNDNSPENIRKEVEASLKNLNTDYIDLYQIHWPDPAVDVERSWETMAALKAEGKVKYIGVSNFNIDLLERCMKIEQVQSLQPPYSMLRRDYEKEVLPYCLENEIGVVAYSPMQAGLLTGEFNINKLAEDDWRRKDKMFNEPYLVQALDFVEHLKPLASKNNITVGQLALAWVLNNPAVTSAIVGARNKRQSAQNFSINSLKLSPEDIASLAGEMKKRGL